MHTGLDRQTLLIRISRSRFRRGIVAWLRDLKTGILRILVMDGPDEWDRHPDAFERRPLSDRPEDHSR